MIETLSRFSSSQEGYNHYSEVPWRLKFPNGKEIRNLKRPDLVFLAVGFGDEVREVRGLFDERIEQYDKQHSNRPGIDPMFYKAISDEDVHSTWHRVDLCENITQEQVGVLTERLRYELKDIPAFTLLYGEKWIVGDGLLSELRVKDQEKWREHPMRLVRAIVGTALAAAGLSAPGANFDPHSTHRYARNLDETRRVEIRDLLNEPDITPAEFQVPGVYVAVNWPERDDANNYGTYKYKILDFIPFKDVDEASGLDVVRHKLITPEEGTKLWTPSQS